MGILLCINRGFEKCTAETCPLGVWSATGRIPKWTAAPASSPPTAARAARTAARAAGATAATAAAGAVIGADHLAFVAEPGAGQAAAVLAAATLAERAAIIAVA